MYSMNFKILYKLTLIFIIFLTCTSFTCANDVNETDNFIDIDQSFVEEEIVCETDDVFIESAGDIHVENQYSSIETNMIYNYSYEYSEIESEDCCDSFVELEDSLLTDNNLLCYDNYSTNDSFNISDSNKDLNLYVIVNNTLFLFTFEMDDICSDLNIEYIFLKYQVTNNSFLKNVKIKNITSIFHDLITAKYVDKSLNEFANDIVIFCNKITTNYAYSINNSIIGNENNLFSIYNNSIFVNLNSKGNFLFFKNFINYINFIFDIKQIFPTFKNFYV